MAGDNLLGFQFSAPRASNNKTFVKYDTFIVRTLVRTNERSSDYGSSVGEND